MHNYAATCTKEIGQIQPMGKYIQLHGINTEQIQNNTVEHQQHWRTGTIVNCGDIWGGGGERGFGSKKGAKQLT